MKVNNGSSSWGRRNKDKREKKGDRKENDNIFFWGGEGGRDAGRGKRERGGIG